MCFIAEQHSPVISTCNTGEVRLYMAVSYLKVKLVEGMNLLAAVLSATI